MQRLVSAELPRTEVKQGVAEWILPRREVFDKSRNRPASSARRLAIETTYTL